MRVKFKGLLTVYRENVIVQHLSAKVVLGANNVLYYPRCPKGFDDIITDPTRNHKLVTFTANEDGSNPRAVALTTK
jgi:hypothetical protein